MWDLPLSLSAAQSFLDSAFTRLLLEAVMLSLPETVQIDVLPSAEAIIAKHGVTRPEFEAALDEVLRAPVAKALRTWCRTDIHHDIALLLMAVADSDPKEF
jgi:hypothetical protein